MRYDSDKKCFISSATPRSDFRKKRLLALKRDNYKCVKCGSTEDLHVHHIIELSQNGTNELDNLLTLCPKCHAKAHENEKVHQIMVNAHYYTKHKV